MIANERQYKITRSQAERFQQALREFNEIDLARQGIDPVIVAAQRASLEQQLAELERDISKYEKLRSGSVKQLAFSTIPEIGEKLVEARIMRGLSQRELAERLGMKEQQVQRYEHERYLTANLTRLAEVADALHLDVRAHLDVRSPIPPSTVASEHIRRIEFDPSKLPLKEMKSRGWLDEVRQRYPDVELSSQELAARFVMEATPENRRPSLHKQNVRAGSKQDDYSLLAWKARVLRKARRFGIASTSNFELSTLRRLTELSEQNDGPVQAVKLLALSGFIVVFEESLPSTYLDGAAMLLDNRTPVIGLTLRHDRLDNFWFVLLHEVAHIVLHREKGLRDGFFDEEEAPSTDVVESEADEFARNALIPNEVWQRSFVRFTSSHEQVIQFAKKNRVSPSVVAGRIRRERRDYTLFSDLVGQGQVRKLISAAGYWET
jgi:HTH-type transcriptional regulator / antitoxin HigA